MTNFTAGTGYVTATYAAQGAVQQLIWGANSGNAVLAQSWTYGPGRLQPTQVAATALGGSAQTAGTNLLTLGYSYCPNGASACTSNNGNAMAQTIAGSANSAEGAGFSFLQSYGYYALNRLVSVAETGGAASSEWSQPFAYDALGNRAIVSGTGVYIPYTGFTAQVAANSAAAVAAIYSNNQWSGANYDPAGTGNVTGMAGIPGLAYAYDAENRLVQVVSATVPSVTFGYDGDGRRVQKTVTTTSGGTTTTSTTVYAYSASGELLAEYGGSAGNSGTQYVVGDALGSTRLVTDVTGTPVERRDYAPFGEELAGGVGGRDSLFGGGSYPVVGSGQVDVEFAGKERDAETGLDYFGARYFSSAQGRWTSPD